LAKFGDRTHFLVSSEQNARSPEVLPSSSYLKGIRKQEAKTLLSRHDYSGVEALIKDYLKDDDTKNLLKAAMQWNFAKFDDFADELEKLSGQPFQHLVQDVKKRRQHWWWEAYEASYLGVVRLEQDNTVEAFFHSFRAFEGLISKWSVFFYPDDIEDRDGKSVVILSDSGKLPEYLRKELEEIKEKGKEKNPEIELYGNRLFQLFQESKPELKNNEDLKAIWMSARNNRNKLFHRLKGLNESSLYKAWGMNSRPSWKKRLLNCLRLISDQPSFKSLAEASLMAKVHQALVSAIAQL
jgi:hypothetical protein